MKAFILEKYDSSNNLKIKNIPKPILKEKEALVKIITTSINDYDWSMITGKPKIYRLMFGFPKPKKNIPGMELAGIIEEIGKNSKCNIGDRVMSDISDHSFGTFAEYISISEDAFTKIPDDMTFEEAVSLPHASLLAIQGLELGGLIENMSVLINGAGGGVGTFAVQIAKRYNCQVTGVDSNDKFERMKELGYDDFIDYRKEDFTKLGKKYDLILDCKSNRSPFKYAKALKNGGRFITVGGEPFSLIKILLFGFIIKLILNKSVKILPLKTNKGLDKILKLNKENKFIFNVDGPYKFDEIPNLINYFGEGKHKGKIVVKVD